MITGVLLAQALVDGTLLGGVYAIFALGLSLLWGIMKIANFAHGAIAFLGSYACFWMFVIYGWNPLEAIAVSAPLLFVLGVAVQYITIRPAQKKTTDLAEFELVTMIVLFGLTIVLEGFMIVFWTSDPRSIDVFYFGRPAFTLTGILRFPTTRIVTFMISIFGVLGVNTFLNKTRTGKAIRSLAQNRDAAALMGVNVSWISAVAFGVAAITMALAGYSISVIFNFSPTGYFPWLIRGFMIVLLGGIGSIRGTLLASFALGIGEDLAAFTIPFGLTLLIPVAVLIVVVAVRPQGFFGRL